MKNLWKIAATFLGLGFSPVAPGTITSFAVVVLYKFALSRISIPLYLAVIVFLFFIGVFVSTRYSSILGKKDPRKIVIDEVCGQMVVLIGLPGTWGPLIIGFFLFRFFDIVKPYPIRKIEKLPTGLGIMMDDLAASVYAVLILHVYLLLK